MYMVATPPTGDDYFRLNLSGMGRFYEAMHQLGMLYDSRSPGAWPAAPSQRIEELMYTLDSGEQPSGTPEELGQARTYAEAIRKHLAAHPPGGDVIPTHKFSTNDGWIVTSDEIKAALAVHDSIDPETATRRLTRTVLTQPNEMEYWFRWIAYLRRAVDHEGFEVH
jgi:hypothetical protein